MRRTVRPAALALALGLTLAGCGDGTSSTAGDPSSASPSPDATSPAASETPSDEPSTTTSASPDEPSGSSTPDTPGDTAAPAADLPGALLPAAEVPGFNDTFTWREGATTQAEPDDAVVCHRFSLVSIGAKDSVTRTYEPTEDAPGARAVETVADFVDARSVRRAEGVLEAWRARCGQRLRGEWDRVRVGDLTQVDAGDGGAWDLAFYGPLPDDPDAGVFEAVGWTRVGTRVAVVDLRLHGQDYNYEPGQEPMVAALQAAAQRLG